jgi:hypothetical protein
MTNPQSFSLSLQHRSWVSAMPLACRETKTITPLASMGPVKIEPFDPAWLGSHPMVLDHVLSEHALHVKGLDDEGEGLTWHAAKFEAAQHNPDLSPECHFQMRVGYFLIPEELLIKHCSAAGPAAPVLNQMSDEIEGKRYVRFFVHPDAYEHYAPLIEDAQIISDREAASHLDRSPHDGKQLFFVTSEASSVLGTPSSSYRSWVVKDTEQEDANPFIIKVGVPCQVLGSDRWLSEAEIERSVNCQMAFETLDAPAWAKEGSTFAVFAESMGVAVSHPLYRRAHDKHSGMLIREFPESVLKGSVRVASCAALMSVESARSGERPWVCDLIDQAIKRGECKDASEFVRQHFIHNYLDAIEPVVLAEGMTIEPHSQNLCVLMSPDPEPRLIGFAYRDHGGIWVDLASRVMRDQRVDFFACGMMPKSIVEERAPTTSKALVKAQGAIDKAYIQSYAWFYRYQVMVKLFNSILGPETREWTPTGAPHQLGLAGPIPERVLSRYLRDLTPDRTFERAATPVADAAVKGTETAARPVAATGASVSTTEVASSAADAGSAVVAGAGATAATSRRVDALARPILERAPTRDEVEALLKEADAEYVRRLDRYFIADTLTARLPLPAVEGGFGGDVEKTVSDHHKFFGTWRTFRPEDRTHNVWNASILERCNLSEAITYNGQALNLDEVTHYVEKPSGFLLFKNKSGDNFLISVIPKTKYNY